MNSILAYKSNLLSLQIKIVVTKGTRFSKDRTKSIWDIIFFIAAVLLYGSYIWNLDYKMFKKQGNIYKIISTTVINVQKKYLAYVLIQSLTSSFQENYVDCGQ